MNTPPAITGKTVVCGVIGDPVEHTVSPAMHNAAFMALGLDYIYVPFRVPPRHLAAAVQGMRALSIRGLNVTIPYKVKVIPLLDEIDSPARSIGAVNVIVNDSSVLKGYNTDAEGFMRALKEHGVEVRGKTAVILGSGGAARAVCFALSAAGAGLIILNRTSGRAARLVGEIMKTAGHPAEAMPLDRPNITTALKKGHILVNTTSVGMSPEPDETLVKGDLIGPQHTVVDIVYNPVETRLLKDAAKAGAATVNGLDMLVWQGALAFEKWTGHKAPVDIMRKTAIEALKGT
jgi:shikimate dehydrogenase